MEGQMQRVTSFVVVPSCYLNLCFHGRMLQKPRFVSELTTEMEPDWKRSSIQRGRITLENYNYLFLENWFSRNKSPIIVMFTQKTSKQVKVDEMRKIQEYLFLIKTFFYNYSGFSFSILCRLCINSMSQRIPTAVF